MFWFSLVLFSLFAFVWIYDERNHHAKRRLDRRERLGLLGDLVGLCVIGIYMWFFPYSPGSRWIAAGLMLVTWLGASKEDWGFDRILNHRERWLHGLMQSLLVLALFTLFATWPFLDGAPLIVGWFLPFDTDHLRWSLALWIVLCLGGVSYQFLRLKELRASPARLASDAPLEVREATPQDAPMIMEFQSRMARESEGLALDPKVLGPGVQALFENPARGRYYVATEGTSVVGCLLVTQEWSDWRNGTIWWIQSVYTAKEARKKGVYRALYRHLQEQVARDPTIKGLRLYVEKENLPARRVYSRLGMSEDRYIVCEWLKDEDVRH